METNTERGPAEGCCSSGWLERFILCVRFDARLTVIGRMLREDWLELAGVLLSISALLLTLPWLVLKAVLHIPALPLTWCWYAWKKPKELAQIAEIMPKRSNDQAEERRVSRSQTKEEKIK